MTKLLFEPTKLGALDLTNRVVVAPMCQYSAIGGTMTDWHMVHLGQFALSGAGLVFVEATGVEPAGRITPGCVGLWNDENEAAMARVIKFFREYGSAKIGIQLAHAGRKGSCDLPWRGGGSLNADDPRGWETFAPSAEPFDTDWRVPTALDAAGLKRIKDAFLQALVRSIRLGFGAVELHSAHGYLLHQFLSPLSNLRNDAYGGDREGRMRYPLEVFEALREQCPKNVPLGVRVSATEWVAGGWDLEDTLEYAKALKDRGCDFIDVSSGGNSSKQQIPAGPGYQAGLAAEIKRTTGMTTIAVGMITEPYQAESIIATGQADMVALARGMLYDPRWPWHAADALRADAPFAPQYQRAHHPFLSRKPVGEPPTGSE
ncbi:MAG: NADH:flavin oxidoreductase/NADH oxidase [Rhodospirillaceae bacterium]